MSNELCQHPTIRQSGTCNRLSIGVYDIPLDYSPPKRHSSTPDIPRPKSRLCRQHLGKVNAHGSGIILVGSSHEAQCAWCQHPQCQRIESLWISWLHSADNLCREFGLTQTTFYRHADYKDLWKLKGSSLNTQRALIFEAQRGFDAGGRSAKTSLMALQLLAKERGDTDKVDVTVNRSELNKMTNDELAELASSIAIKLKGEK